MTHKQYINYCFHLAKLGLGTTYPNPLVGAVVVYNNKIIGQGWHKKAGEPHAEVNAINSVKDKSLLPYATLYVNLEPCNHIGRTGACSHYIVHHKIPKVVFAQSDFAEHLKETGITYLRKNGVEVINGILKNEAEFLNRRFNTFHIKKRPYIILKWAETQNHYFAPTNTIQKWISNKESKQLAHKWRTEEQAILIGSNTAKIDDPQLNARLWKGCSPIKIVLDSKLNVKASSNIFNEGKTLVYNNLKDYCSTQIDYIKVKDVNNSLDTVLSDLYKKDINSVIVEGGVKTLQSFIKLGLWDEYRVFRSPNYWTDGIKAPELPCIPTKEYPVNTNSLIIGYNHG